MKGVFLVCHCLTHRLFSHFKLWTYEFLDKVEFWEKGVACVNAMVEPNKSFFVSFPSAKLYFREKLTGASIVSGFVFFYSIVLMFIATRQKKRLGFIMMKYLTWKLLAVL